MLALSKPLSELTRVMLKKLYVTTLTILLRWYACAPGSEQVLGAVGIEWWYHGVVWKLPATGLQTPLACLGYATQERRGIPRFLAPGGDQALQPLRLAPHRLVAIALHEMPQLRRGRTGFQPIEPAQQGVEGAVGVTGVHRRGETAEVGRFAVVTGKRPGLIARPYGLSPIQSRPNGSDSHCDYDP